LKIPKIRIEEPVVETPRQLIMMESVHEKTPEATPRTVEFTTKMELDPKVIMTTVTEESRQISLDAVQTALEITKVIKSSVRNIERGAMPTETLASQNDEDTQSLASKSNLSQRLPLLSLLFIIIITIMILTTATSLKVLSLEPLWRMVVICNT